MPNCIWLPSSETAKDVASSTMVLEILTSVWPVVLVGPLAMKVRVWLVELKLKLVMVLFDCTKNTCLPEAATNETVAVLSVDWIVWSPAHWALSLKVPEAGISHCRLY